MKRVHVRLKRKLKRKRYRRRHRIRKHRPLTSDELDAICNAHFGRLLENIGTGKISDKTISDFFKPSILQSQEWEDIIAKASMQYLTE